MTPLGALALERCFNETALAYCWGAGGFVTAIARGGARVRLQSVLRRSLLLSSGIAVVTSLVAIPFQTSVITSEWALSSLPQTVLKVAVDTSSGRAMLLHAIICAAMFAATFARTEKVFLVAAALAVGSVAMSGHAGDTVVASIVDAVHVLSATAWVGALIPFLLLLNMANRPGLRSDAVCSMQRFSAVGHVAVGLVLASGLANTLLILGHPRTDLTSPFQFKLVIKIAVALAMTCLALVNRYLIVPRCRSYPRSSQRLLILGTSAEIMLGLSAFALVASLGLDDPA
ncbi:CopD family protein [Rhizobium sp. 0TCS1.26]|uniref:CopD family protein n=1 Tax=Rhizobium sp. 0TCS1.26 TaxID=3142623 RepID=UPI003D2989E1